MERKFISGLPHLFVDKIRKRIGDRCGGILAYENLSYGELTSEVISEGLTFCNKLKL